MKNKKGTIFVIVIGIVILFSIPKADVLAQQENEKQTMVSYEYNNENELLITFRLSELLEKKITNDLGNFIQFEIPNAGFIGEIGSPQTPAVTKLVAVSTHHHSLEILDSHIMETRHIETMYPLQNPQTDSQNNEESIFVYNKSAYQKDDIFPQSTAEIVNSGKIRDIPYIKIRFNPVHYNPYQQMVTIYDTIKIRLTFYPDEPLVVEPNYTQKEYYPLYENIFNNWQTFVKNTVFQEQTTGKEIGCDYLIITHQNYYTQATELASWKYQTGFQTKTINVSDIGTTYQQIRQFIINAYSTWVPRPSYILLFGDAEFVPTTYLNGVATDLWYAAVEGTDYYPDLFIGRIPADTPAQAEVMVQKILTYEQTPPLLPSFYNNFVVAAYFQDDNMNGYEDRRFVLTSEEVRDYLLSQGYNGQRIYCTDSSINPTHYNNDYYANGEPLPAELLRPGFAWDGDADDIINAIQQGIFILNHRDHGMESGWGDPYFTTEHFDSFSNGELLPVVFSLNCLTGKFDTLECFCEEFLRKDDGGAVAVFGASDVSYSGYNDYLCRGMYDALWPDFDTEIGTDVALYHLGEVLNYGKAFMADTWGDPWDLEEYEFELFHLFGDPSLDMYTALPGTLEATYTFLSDTIQVTVEATGNPIKGARVCLYQDSGFYRTGMTDENGVIQFDKTGASIDEAVNLVATAHNYLYYSDSFLLNQRPQKPNRPTGSLEGKPNVEYMYKTSTIDVDGDRLYYNFSWGDGTYSGWIGPFDSGAEAFARHAWAEEGSYNITVKAQDVKGDESEWSDPLSITMPLEFIPSHPILQWIYEIIINRFPCMGFLLGMLRDNSS